MNGLSGLKNALRTVGEISPRSIQSFTASTATIVSTVSDKIDLDMATLKDEEVKLSEFIKDYSPYLAGTLAAVYRYALWEELVEEAVTLLSALSARGMGPRHFERLMKTWIIAVQGFVSTPGAFELTRPLEILANHAETLCVEAAARSASSGSVEADSLARTAAEEGLDATLARVQGFYRETGSVDEVIDRLVFPSLSHLGNLWARNDIGVADEHAATAVMRAAIQRFFDTLGAGRRRGESVIVACVPGDEHELGAEITARYLSYRGWRVNFIGHSAPESELLRAVEPGGYFAAVLSASMIWHLPSLDSLAGGLRRRSPSIRLIAGGTAALRAQELVRTIVDGVARSPARCDAILDSMVKDNA